MKKSTDDFLNEIVIPIEKIENDSGNLYVLMNTNLPFIKDGFISYSDFAIDTGELNDGWSLSTDINPGKWIEGDAIHLKTLSGIIWHGTKGGRLFKAESEGETEKLNLHDFFYYMTATNEYQRNQLQGMEHIDNCIYLLIFIKIG